MNESKHHDWVALIRANRAIVILVIVFILHAGGLLWFLAADQTQPYKDVGNQYRIVHSLIDGRLPDGRLTTSVPGRLWNAYIASSQDDGPTFQIVAVLMASLFSPSHDVIVSANLVFLAILIGATYALGSHLFNRDVGLVAAATVGSFPVVFYSSRLGMVDLSLAAFVTLSIWALLRTEKFTDKSWSMRAGVCLGLAALSKISFPLFLFIPFAAETVNSIVPAMRRRSHSLLMRRMKNLAICLLIASAMALPWHLIHIPQFLGGFEDTYLASLSPDDRSFTGFLHASKYYEWFSTDWLLLLRGLMSDVFLVGFILALFSFFRARRHQVVMLGWLLPALLSFPVLYAPERLLSVDHMRYFVPLFPLIALLLARLAVQISQRVDAYLAARTIPYSKALHSGVLILFLALHINMYVTITSDARWGYKAFVHPLGDLFEIGDHRLTTLSRSTATLYPNRILPRFDELKSEIARRLVDGEISVLLLNREGRFGHTMSYQLIELGREYDIYVDLDVCALNGTAFNDEAMHAFVSIDACQKRLTEVDLIILDPMMEGEESSSPSWDESTREFLDEYLFKSDLRLLYAIRSEIEVEQWRALSNNHDYLSTDAVVWGSSSWHRDLQADSLNGIGGVIYIKDSLP